MNLKKLPQTGEMLEIALRRARKEAATIGKQASRLKWEKIREIKRIEVSANYVVKRLKQTVEEFPSLEKIPAFQRELIEALVDAAELKNSLSQMSSVSKIVRKLKREHIVGVKKLGRGNEGQAKKISREFLGRLASTLKSLRKSIEVYNKAAEKLRELPHIKELPTAIIAGCPNAGKSTLLRKLTESKPKIAAYPFTTQRLELGYFKQRYQEIQVIDTPGLLDRPLAERNPVERKGIAALKHLAGTIVFVVDVTGQCGFSLEKQLKLLQSIAGEFGKGKIAVYLSKTDIASKWEIKEAKAKAGGFSLLQGSRAELWEGIAEMLLGK